MRIISKGYIASLFFLRKREFARRYAVTFVFEPSLSAGYWCCSVALLSDKSHDHAVEVEEEHEEVETEFDEGFLVKLSQLKLGNVFKLLAAIGFNL